MHKFVIMGVFSLMAFSSQAAYLYWRVNSTDYTPEALRETADYARVAAVDSDGNITYIGKNVSIEKAPETFVATSLADLSDPSAYSFYIELLNYDSSTMTTKIVGVSQDPTSYATMVSSGYIDTGTTPITPTAVWHGSPIVIPEPTTGLLVTVGMGLLALRRRRKIGIAG